MAHQRCHPYKEDRMSKPRLLVIDDEMDICELIADVADTRGFEVKTASDPAEVEGLLHSFKPTAIMLDLMMPGTDGVELLRNLGDAIKGCAVVLMSGHDARVLNSARRLGSAHGINVIGTQEKPIEVEALRVTLALLANAGAQEEDKRVSVNSDDLKTEEIALFYQPIVDMTTGRIRGLEGLARWQHPTQGIVTPDHFIEKLGVSALDELAGQIMQIAVKDLTVLHAQGFPLSVSINMTASNLIDLGVPDRLDELCRSKGIANEKITIEVTEGEAMRDVRKIMDVLTRLRLKGFGVAIDDFGVGYSSLRELQRMPFSSMKMDKSFVLDLAENRDSQVIAGTIIDLGHNLGMKVVAEGVETAGVWTILKDRGCDLAQGYLISRPTPLNTLIGFLTEKNGVFSL